MEVILVMNQGWPLGLSGRGCCAPPFPASSAGHPRAGRVSLSVDLNPGHQVRAS